MLHNNCLIKELKKLKESSKEAVENLNSFSAFKNYMHVKREVQDQLFDLIKQASEVDESQLILVCGGVGDGKSHLISYLIDKHPELMKRFDKHNDATESLEPQKTSIDTLNDVLDAFSDEGLGSGAKTKLILAINLGALNNFIDSKYKDRFTKLINYVNSQKILEASIINNTFNQESNFQFINFSDYHIFTLTDEGPRSEYIKEILNKVTGADKGNPFYQAYEDHCLKCEQGYRCPIKENYEMLSKENVKQKIIDILVEAIVKNKIIISTRSLLNFIYDLVVNNELDNANTNRLADRVKNLKFEEHIKYNFTSNLYGHKELSNILEAISDLDPIKTRRESLDDIIINLNITEDMGCIFSEYLNVAEGSYIRDSIFNNTNLKEIFNQIKLVRDQETFKNDLIKLFVRQYLFTCKNTKLNLEDKIYKDYMKSLYYWNKGERKSLSSLYEDINSAIYKWNGVNQDENIGLLIGKNQVKYKTSQKLNIEPYLDDLPYVPEDELVKFVPNLILKFTNADRNEIYNINIDFNLYKLLVKVKDGYRPNKKDKHNYISFVEFIQKIKKLGNQNKELLIEDRNGNETRRFKLTYNKSFDEYRFTEIKGV
ncbi:DNA phosphorothioation-dependent restriction protein DptF [Anaerovirgula multivorans]|uniref:DNA phosphorothioation-dependent restriction protein DptF n=1 Tax=Anaerovirgula multivorans TaxID=312168 RepID=A0A239CK71_9FIRM|nr:DNA phosphorothioation-dependent restriction protein DptF [Anaerovirgula multivorans]SNS20339.1 DNA phosphorothioation-dependent restriction protein DptF [Anaerovirgula multivorans]